MYVKRAPGKNCSLSRCPSLLLLQSLDSTLLPSSSRSKISNLSLVIVSYRILAIHKMRDFLAMLLDKTIILTVCVGYYSAMN